MRRPYTISPHLKPSQNEKALFKMRKLNTHVDVNG
jgi:hypothetical protein